MGILELLQLIILFTVTGYGIIIAQMFALARVLKSRAWLLLAFGFTAGGGRLIWQFIRVPLALLRAQERGELPTGLNFEQWLNVGLVYLTLVLWIAGLHLLRNDLRRVGA